MPLQYCEDIPAELETSPVDTTPTWHRDIAPLVGVRCGGCHAEGELAPFLLQEHADYASRVDLVRDSVLTGRMPPWSAEPCCGREYQGDRSLRPEELDTLVAWLDAGAPEGDPDEEPVDPPDTAGQGLDRVDVEVSMAEPYTPEARYGSDDSRCFIVELPPEARGTMAVGSRVIPGQVAVVHHVILALAEGKALQEFEALDAEDPGPGWDCYGGFGARLAGNLGGYVPGQTGAMLPEGFGMPIGEEAALVLNMHYDLSAVQPGGSAEGADPTDRSTVQLMLDDTVEKELTGIPILHPLWLYDEGMHLEGDFAETSYGFSWDPQVVYGRGKSWDVWGVLLHMHELGQRGSVSLLRADGTQECLLHVDDWDFDWQADYWLTEPVRLAPGDEVYVECHWTNPGEDMAWEADQEMCAGGLMVAAVEE